MPTSHNNARPLPHVLNVALKGRGKEERVPVRDLIARIHFSVFGIKHERQFCSLKTIPKHVVGSSFDVDTHDLIAEMPSFCISKTTHQNHSGSVDYDLS